MASKKALYYPHIDIENESWLKNATLYWDEIQTIVPEGMRKPYETPVGQELQEMGILTPFNVDTILYKVEEELTKNVINYLNASEGLKILNNTDKLQYPDFIYSKKFPSGIFDRILTECENIHPDDISNLFEEVKLFFKYDESESGPNI